MIQKNKHMFKTLFIAGVSVLAMACGSDNSTMTAGFSSGDDLLKGSAFDDSQSSTGTLGLRVRCEVRSDRSKVSVDGNNIASGSYKASITSGGATVTSGVASATGDEVEFDFDSENDDIAEGATAIDANFIQGGKVTAKILTANGQLVAGLENVTCENK